MKAGENKFKDLAQKEAECTVSAEKFLDRYKELAYMQSECTLDIYPDKEEEFKKMEIKLLELLTFFGD
jgi:hypothetical protein